MIPGILVAFSCAFAQALCYLCSRWFMSRGNRTPLDLLVLSHVIMGAASVFLLPVVWPSGFSLLDYNGLIILIDTLAYLLGQLAFFLALKHAEPSRVSPMLGIKVFMVALFAALLYSRGFTPLQMLSIILCAISVIMLNWTGQRIPSKALLWIVLTCIGYSVSDLCGQIFIDFNNTLPSLQRSVLFVLLSYAFCGMLSLGILPFLPKTKVVHWLTALPFSILWFMSMFLLFYSFTFIGVVYAVIVQSSRGLLSILLAVAIARMGWVHIESHVSRRVLILRILAAILMVLAIGLYHGL